jgi:general secretion pathway protein J
MSAATKPQRGFTLVEVLVALVLMAIMSGFAWRALDGVLRSRQASREAIETTSRLATVLTQWEQDLQAVHDTGLVPPLAFDGQTLRLTRRVDDGVALVTWAVRGGLWQRWASAPQVRAAGLQQAWLASQQFLGNEVGQLTVANDTTQWQVYFYRGGGGWSNAQSTGNLVAPPAGAAPTPPAAPPPAGGPGGTTGEGAGRGGGAASPFVPSAVPQQREELPQAVRLVITLKPGQLTRDVALGPTGS